MKVSKEIEALLGMNQDQFSQVALLPQGEFKRLLCADSGEREKLLQKLFGTRRYTQIEDALAAKKKALDERAEQLATKRGEVLRTAGLEAAVPEALAARRKALEEEAAEARGSSDERDRALVARDEELRKARDGKKSFDALDAARKELTRSHEAAAAVENDRDRVKRANAAAMIRGPLDEAGRAHTSAVLAREEQSKAEHELEQAKREAVEAREGAEAQEAYRPKRDAQARRRDLLKGSLGDLDELGRKREVLESATGAAESAATTLAAKAAALASEERSVRDGEAEEARLSPLAGALASRMERHRELTEALRQARERDAVEAEVNSKALEERKAVDLEATAVRAAAAARELAADTAAARERGLAAWLAKTGLQDGKPCPVCGSAVHPAPATSEGVVPDQSQVDAARAESERKATLAAEATSKLGSQRDALADLRRRAKELTAAQSAPLPELQAREKEAAGEVAEARNAANQIGNVRSGLVKARERVEQARRAVVEATGRDARAREELTRVSAECEGLAARLARDGVGQDARDELGKIERELGEAERAAEDAIKRKVAAEKAEASSLAALEAAKGTLRKAEEGAEAAQRRAEAAALEHGFSSAQESTAALLADEARAALDASIQKRVADALAAEKAVSDLELALENQERPDVDAAQGARDAAAKEATRARDAWVRLGEELKRLAEIATRVAELDGSLDEVEREAKVVGHVANLVAGSNQKSMNLQRFVLAARLEEVAEAASARLLVMSRGRFRLRHDTSVARKNSAAGLSLVVEDAHTGVTDRPVGALSGGESFLASLALALGLSDVVVAHSGGRRLDSLFVDEGFGTLDEETLDVAVRALEELRLSGRLVGVISHVAELRRRIPARVEVVSTANGAVATVHPA